MHIHIYMHTRIKQVCANVCTFIHLRVCIYIYMAASGSRYPTLNRVGARSPEQLADTGFLGVAVFTSSANVWGDK